MGSLKRRRVDEAKERLRRGGGGGILGGLITAKNLALVKGWPWACILIMGVKIGRDYQVFKS